MQQKTIKLQDLVQSKDEQIWKISSVAQESAESSLKEITSYSQALQKEVGSSQPVISSSTLQKVVKTVVQEENHAKNIMIIGLQETNSEELQGRVQELFSVIEERPKSEVQRIGKQKAGTVRPVKVKFRNGAMVRQILKKSYGLKNSEWYKKVYLVQTGQRRSG